MFCGKCGAQNEEGADFCKDCGAPLKTAPAQPAQPVQPAPAAQPAAAAKASFASLSAGTRNKYVGIAAIAAVAVIVIIILAVVLTGGRSYKSTVNTFMSGLFKPNAQSVLNMVPKKVLSEVLQDSGYTKKELINELNNELKEQYDYLTTYFGKWKYSYKVTGSEKVTGSDLEWLKGRYADLYNLKVSEARDVDVMVTITVNGEKQSKMITIPVVKIGRSWYLDTVNLGSLSSLVNF